MQDGQFHIDIEDPKPKFDPKKPFKSVNGQKPAFDPQQPFKKKDEISDTTQEPLQNGIVPTVPSPSKLPSEVDEAVQEINFQQGLQFQEQPQSKKPAIYSIAELAKKQNEEDNLVLSAAIPANFPAGQPNPVIQQNIDNSKEKDVLAGDPNAITSVVNRQQQELNKKKKELSANLKGIDKAAGYGGDLSSMNEERANLDTDITEVDEKQKQLINSATEALNKVYAQKFDASPDKSVNVQNTLGSELRSHQSKIGSDPTYQDEKGIAGLVPAAESLANSPDIDFGPVKNVLKKRLEVIKNTGQEHEFTNRAVILNAAYEQSGERLMELSNDPEVQKGLNGTAEQQAELANNPNVQEAKKLLDDFNNTGGQLDNLVNQYPQVKAKKQAEQVANLWADHILKAEKGELGIDEMLAQSRDPFLGRKLNTPEEIKAIVDASNGTLTEEEVKKYADQARVPSFFGNILRGFGGSFTDTQEGINRLTQSKVSADIANKTIEEGRYRTPESLQGFSNFNNILSTMFTGTGNIVGLGVQGAIGGEIIGGLTGLSKLASLAKTSLKALQEGEQILPAGKFADLLVSSGVARTRQEALAQVANASVKAKNMAGVYSSIYLPTYEAAYQEASKFSADESKRNEYASQVANANGLAMLILNPPNLAGKVFKSVPNERVVANFLKTEVPFGAADVFKARLGELAKPLLGAVPATVIPLAQETISKENIFNFHTSASEFLNEAMNRTLSMAVSVLPLGILGASKVTTSEYLKSSLYEVGKQPELMRSNIEEAFNRGEFTNDEKNRQISVVNTLADLVRNTPDKNNDGKVLTQQEKNNLVYLQLQNGALRVKQAVATPEVQPHYEKEVNENKKVINETMQPPKVEELKTETDQKVEQPEKTDKEIEKMFRRSLLGTGDERKSIDPVQWSDPVTGKKETITPRVAQMRAEKRYNILKDFVDCII